MKYKFNTIESIRKNYENDKALSISNSFAYMVIDMLPLGLDEDEILESICDGSNDNQIDAIVIKDKRISIFSFKHTELAKNGKKSFPSRDLSILSKTVCDILNDNTSHYKFNKLLSEKVIEISNLLETYPGEAEIEIYVCTNKQAPDKNEVEKLTNDISEIIGDKLSVNICDQKYISNLIINRNKITNEGTFQFHSKEFFTRGEVNAGFDGIFGLIYATDFIKLITNEKGSIDSSVFEKNIRTYIKRKKNNVNQQIYDTLMSDDNKFFWILNNGINIVCEKCSNFENNSPFVKIENYQIVNGGQTSRVLFDVHEESPKKLEDVRILVRICVTGDEGLGKKISRASNSQTAIRNRDLCSNDQVQIHLEAQFKELGYLYERKKDQHKGTSNSIDSEKIAQIYLAFYLEKPSEARDQKRIIWDREYTNIFSDDVTALKMSKPLKLFNLIQDQRKMIVNKKKTTETIDDSEAFVSYASYHILYTCRLLRDKIGKIGNENIDIFDNHKHQEIIIKNAKTLLYELIKTDKKENNRYNHNSFFKKISTNKLIKEAIIKKGLFDFDL